MDKLSITSLIIVSLPDAVMVALIGLVSIGKFSYFKNANNFIRIAIFGVLSAVIIFFSRAFVRNVVEQLVVSILLYSLLFIFIMRLKFYESILASLFGMIVLVFMEVIITPPILALTNTTMLQIYQNDWWRFIYSSPERIIQVILVFLSMRFKIKIFDFDSTNIKKMDYYIQIFVTLLSTVTLIFLVAVITKALLFDRGDFTNATTLLLLRLNLYISLFITVILVLALKSTNEYYQKKHDLNNNEYRQSLEYLSELIKEKRIDMAEETIDKLKQHIAKEH